MRWTKGIPPERAPLEIPVLALTYVDSETGQKFYAVVRGRLGAWEQGADRPTRHWCYLPSGAALTGQPVRVWELPR